MVGATWPRELVTSDRERLGHMESYPSALPGMGLCCYIGLCRDANLGSLSHLLISSTEGGSGKGILILVIKVGPGALWGCF